MVFLTKTQRDDLHQAIAEYLTNNFKDLTDSFCKAAGIQLAIPKESSKQNHLEKKWSTVIKLQRQVWDLEKQMKSMKEGGTCERCDALGDMGSLKVGDGLPREPEKYTLTGHQGNITKVAVHPMYNFVASASEDAKIRFWDFEQGEHERTLKGHAG